MWDVLELLVDVSLQPGFTNTNCSSDSCEWEAFEQQAVYEGSGFCGDGFVGWVLGELPVAVSAFVVLLVVSGEAVFDGVGGTAVGAGGHA